MNKKKRKKSSDSSFHARAYVVFFVHVFRIIFFWVVRICWAQKKKKKKQQQQHQHQKHRNRNKNSDVIFISSFHERKEMKNRLNFCVNILQLCIVCVCVQKWNLDRWRSKNEKGQRCSKERRRKKVCLNRDDWRKKKSKIFVSFLFPILQLVTNSAPTFL